VLPGHSALPAATCLQECGRLLACVFLVFWASGPQQNKTFLTLRGNPCDEPHVLALPLVRGWSTGRLEGSRFVCLWGHGDG